MATFTLRAKGKADPDEVWERYVVPSRWREWSPQIQSVDVAADRLIDRACGDVIGPLGLRVPFRVGRVDELGRTWDWTVKVPVLGAELHLHHEVTRTPGGSATMLRLHGPLVLTAPYLPLAQFALHRLCR